MNNDPPLWFLVWLMFTLWLIGAALILAAVRWWVRIVERYRR